MEWRRPAGQWRRTKQLPTPSNSTTPTPSSSRTTATSFCATSWTCVSSPPRLFFHLSPFISLQTFIFSPCLANFNFPLSRSYLQPSPHLMPGSCDSHMVVPLYVCYYKHPPPLNVVFLFPCPLHTRVKTPMTQANLCRGGGRWSCSVEVLRARASVE